MTIFRKSFGGGERLHFPTGRGRGEGCLRRRRGGAGGAALSCARGCSAEAESRLAQCDAAIRHFSRATVFLAD